MFTYSILTTNDYIGPDSHRILGVYSSFKKAKLVAKKWLNVNLDTTHIAIYKQKLDDNLDEILDNIVLLPHEVDNMRVVIYNNKELDTWNLLDELCEIVYYKHK